MILLCNVGCCFKGSDFSLTTLFTTTFLVKYVALLEHMWVYFITAGCSWVRLWSSKQELVSLLITTEPLSHQEATRHQSALLFVLIKFCWPKSTKILSLLSCTKWEQGGSSSWYNTQHCCIPSVYSWFCQVGVTGYVIRQALSRLPRPQSLTGKESRGDVCWVVSGDSWQQKQANVWTSTSLAKFRLRDPVAKEGSFLFFCSFHYQSVSHSCKFCF